ncbi:hypothetical protein, partial [Mycoplasmopsis bovis]|uniref:hypothetical protein n=1 Tax=Mycoplasmopsis bovis TaxID=28903 RepID=UPI003D2CB9A6
LLVELKKFPKDATNNIIMPTSATILNIVPTTNKTKYFWFGAIIAAKISRIIIAIWIGIISK